MDRGWFQDPPPTDHFGDGAETVRFPMVFDMLFFLPPSTPPPADSYLILRLMNGCWFGGRFEAQDRHLMVPELLFGGLEGAR